MRIISGKLQRFRFQPPKGFPSRPTTDFAKEGLFNILMNERPLKNLEILDLFSGTGNISFEFASREAGNITAVDKNYKCTRFIKQFVREFKLEHSFNVVKSDIFQFIQNQSKSYDIVFADPPFDTDIHNELINKVMEGNLLNKDGLFILEHNKHHSIGVHKTFQSQRKYGGVLFSFFKHSS